MAVGLIWLNCGHAISGQIGLFRLHIEQLRMVPGNGIQGTYAVRRQAVNEWMAEASSLGWSSTTGGDCTFLDFMYNVAMPADPEITIGPSRHMEVQARTSLESQVRLPAAFHLPPRTD